MKEHTINNEALVSIPMLKHRGWSDAMITRFLPSPDAVKPNPRYATGPKMRMFLELRVIQVESTNEFKLALQKAKANSNKARSAANRRRQRLLDEVSRTMFEVPSLPLAVVRQRAIEHYNQSTDYASNESVRASEQSDAEFLDRLTVNYIRHQLTTYDRRLDSAKGSTGAAEARLEIQERVLDTIADVYPDLADECHHQINRKWKNHLASWPS